MVRQAHHDGLSKGRASLSGFRRNDVLFIFVYSEQILNNNINLKRIMHKEFSLFVDSASVDGSELDDVADFFAISDVGGYP
jgi:hypothetical protein